MISTHTEIEAARAPSDEALAGLVHDLRNYIQIATSAINIMSRHADVAASDSLGSIVAHAADSLQRAGELVRHSDDPDRAIADDLGLSDSLAEMAPLLRYACGPDIRIKLLVGLVPRIRCGRLGLQNALLNLALNARDAMPMGGTLSISATLANGPETPEVELVVADTGHGMPQVILERAFEPHFSTKPSGAGHGMGLSGVRRFIEQLGGRVYIASAEQVGTTVTLRLPAA
ncbi:hypothetical protein VW23_004400 [Devosia insulae DS-56]|uniref:histidine kinase n=1 Tax=Devosia insulae DS-56 TaxID=1116389 RepID=A0A1E5XIS3_9HYPH|nr:sensor histidine kinase [Devosia insulae]OEO28506.1 hypothetical protein VW23_004400 [Devosia insulae DS-56]